MTFNVYGLFTEAGILIYVGCTANIKKRLQAHRNGVFARRHGVLTLRVISEHETEGKGRSQERRFIRQFTSQGLCCCNKAHRVNKRAFCGAFKPE